MPKKQEMSHWSLVCEKCDDNCEFRGVTCDPEPIPSTKFRAEVEYDDDGAAMAGACSQSIRRAEIIELLANDENDYRVRLEKEFKEKRYYSTIRDVRNVQKVKQNSCNSIPKNANKE
jgi:hypothetical protein